MTDSILENFPDNGYADLGTVLYSNDCVQLRSLLNTARPLSKDIFYSTQEEFNNKGRWHHYAPGRDSHNVLIDNQVNLAFIEDNETFVEICRRLCGSDYAIMKKSVVRSVSDHLLPEWINDKVRDVGRPNLNPFIHDDYQDVQHFLHTDYHQDKTRPTSNFVTVYIYLDEVSKDYSALRILEGSHRLGMTSYPHNLRKSWPNDDHIFYSDNSGNHLKCRPVITTGGPGTVVCFHGMTLHGTVTNKSEDPRISLRYLITCPPGTGNDSLLDKANRRVIGPHSASNLRLDVAEDGSLLPTGSSILDFERVN